MRPEQVLGGIILIVFCMGMYLSYKAATLEEPPRRLIEDIEEPFPERWTPEERELQKHDRLLVHGISYINGLTMEDGQAWSLQTHPDQQICIIIQLGPKPLSYLPILLTSFLTGQSASSLTSFAQIHLVHPPHYPLDHLSIVLDKLPFLQRHVLKESAALRSSLELCASSQLAWCLLLEEDVVVPNHFVALLETHILPRLKGEGPAVLSLYSRFWRREQYGLHKSLSNAERRMMRLPPYVPHFEMIGRNGSDTVALLLSRHRLHQLQVFLNGTEGSTGELMNVHFPQFVGVPSMQVEPSLVNHIGFYADGLTLPLDTDIRFSYDAGD